MNSSELYCSVSTSGDLVALCTPDGVIKFYETLTSQLKHEYSSSTHLQACCTCLSWSRHKKKTVVKQKKAKTSSGSINNIENELINLDLIAIGTSQGAVLLFSLSKGSLHSQLSVDGHSDKVNDICWDPQFKDSLFSCSDDGFIVEWSLIEAKMKSKWKAFKTAITAINLDATSKYLLIASKTITVWDLETKTKFKSFTGHSNDIFKMMFLSNKNVFISAALNDRIINTWNLDLSVDNKNVNSTASVSFSVNEGPVYIDAVTTLTSIIENEENKSNTYALICAVTNKGHLFIYNHPVDTEQTGKLKKPVKSVHQVKIETPDGNPLSIYGAFFMNEINERLEHFDQAQIEKLNLQIVYGSLISPIIEKIEFSSLTSPKTVLKRTDPSKVDVTLQTQSTKIETPSVSKELRVLVPGFMAPQTTNMITSSNATSKRKSIEPNQMSLEERLNVMGIESSNGTETDELYSKQGQQIPKTDNLLILLIQGLQSNDAKMLNHVLQHQNEKVVTKTVRMLPTNYVISLVKELNKRLQGHAQSGMGIIKWLKCVLMIHTSYLMSYPDLIDSLGSVYEMMNARTKLFPQLSKLQGKLQLVMTQVSSQAEALQTNDKDGQALLYYQDSNSEDEQVEEELIPSHSEFDDYLFSDEDEEDDIENDNEDMKDSNK